MGDSIQWAKLGTGFTLACAQMQFQKSIVLRVFFFRSEPQKIAVKIG